MREFILRLHIVSSTVLGLMALLLVVRSFFGYWRKRNLTKMDEKLPLWVLIMLYVQLFLGGVLYLYLLTDYSGSDLSAYALRRYNMRFWAVEHFILMAFTLVISHIGWVFARNCKTPEIIFKKNIIYFGAAFVMIVLSMTMNVIRHAS
jgi:hypothetical protein